ncbi:MAG: DHHW family protein [Oscillospiraceae bacterium]|nr:DHHW family protein [Oscillospiraceae bacterium]
MNNLHKKLLIGLFAGLVLALSAATFILMPKEASPFSENENTYFLPFIKPDFKGYPAAVFSHANILSNRPPKSNNIIDRRFMNRFELWFSDRFAFREDWIIFKNELEVLQGKTEINGIFNVGGRLIMANRGEPDSVTDSVLFSVDDFAFEMKEAFDIDSYIMLVPTAQEIYKDSLPPNSRPGNQAALIKYCYDNLPSLTHIDVATYLAENASRYIYYRTDHHWTADGAYRGYYTVALKLGFTPYSVGRFAVEHASTDFRGTLFSRTLNFKIIPDTISLYTLSASSSFSPPEIKLTVNDGATISEYDSLYLREFLEVKDKYAVFMGQNSPIMHIETDIENGKSLIVFKDSFAHSVLPFLANHYSKITVFDMRYLNEDIREYVDLNEYEQVLFLFEVTNFAWDKTLMKLDSVR